MLDQVFLETRVIAIIRGVPKIYLRPLIEAMEKGGIRFAEITLNSESALDSIREMRSVFEGRMHIGAGTVTDLGLLRQALDAGAEFIVTPNIDPQVIEYCIEHDIMITPGAFSPTEMFQAQRYGSKFIKVFPAGSLGPRYIKDVLGPLGHDAQLIAVGGISSQNAADYIAHGAAGVSVGGSLCDMQRIESGDFDWIAMEAQKIIEACRRA